MNYEISEHAHRINMNYVKVEELLSEIARLSDDGMRLKSALRHWSGQYDPDRQK